MSLNSESEANHRKFYYLNNNNKSFNKHVPVYKLNI